VRMEFDLFVYYYGQFFYYLLLRKADPLSAGVTL
jgi:hypothetical protein